jgi:ribosomal-protein-alanine N-acetyltransferase
VTDPPELAALHARCFTSPRPWSAREFAELLGDASIFLCHAPQGFLLGRVVVDEAELLTLAVTPEARRQGTGRQLLDDFHAECQRRGAVTAFLEVAADNLPAVALYRGSGWHESGRRRGYYRRPDAAPCDALVFVRSLP